MPSETDVLNAALGKAGQSRITGIDDGSINANWCKVYYPEKRRGLLRAHHWNFAEKRVELAQDAVAPAFEFAYSYTLPADLLKVKEYNGDVVAVSTTDPFYWLALAGRYKVEGRQLLTNDGIVKIVYIYDVTNPDQWDALFYEVVVAFLASDLAMVIGKDSRKSETLLNQAVTLLLPLAAAVDGQEGTVTPYVVDDLIWGR